MPDRKPQHPLVTAVMNAFVLDRREDENRVELLQELEKTLLSFEPEPLHEIGQELLNIARILDQGGQEGEAQAMAKAVEIAATRVAGQSGRLAGQAEVSGQTFRAFKAENDRGLPTAASGPSKASGKPKARPMQSKLSGMNDARKAKLAAMAKALEGKL